MPIPDYPITTTEQYLAVLAGENTALPDHPITQEQRYLVKLCGEDEPLPRPVTITEFYLAALCGMDVTPPNPVTNLHRILAGHLSGTLPELCPVSREEEYWMNISLGEWDTVTGNAPLSLPGALAKPIRSLIRYGLCEAADGEIYCNNGKLTAVDDDLPAEYQRQIGFEYDAETYYLIPNFHLRGSDTVRLSFSATKACNVFGCYTNTTASDNYSMYASTTASGKYLRYDGDTYNSYIPSSRFGERIDVVITPTGTTGMPTDSVITPATFESVADLCIGTTSPSASSSKLDGNIWGNFVVDERLTLIPCKRLSDDALGYYDPASETFHEPIGSAPVSLGVDESHLNVLSVVGTPEVLTIGQQTASVVNLFEVNGTADEQDIITGVVTRKTAVSVAAGVITISALADLVTERVEAQPLNTAEGDNTVTATANVSPIALAAEYETGGQSDG